MTAGARCAKARDSRSISGCALLIPKPLEHVPTKREPFERRTGPKKPC
jgi:hypothetical protein